MTGRHMRSAAKDVDPSRFLTICSALAQAVQLRKAAEQQSLLASIQMRAKRIYDRKEVEVIVGFLIVMNFVNTIVEHEIFVHADFQGSVGCRTPGNQHGRKYRARQWY